MRNGKGRKVGGSQWVLTTFIESFTVDFHAVDDGDDGGIDRDQFEALRGAGRAALAEEHEFTFPGTDGIDGDDGVSPILEFGRVFVIDEFGTKQEKFPSDHEFVFFRRDNLSNDFCEKH